MKLLEKSHPKYIFNSKEKKLYQPFEIECSSTPLDSIFRQKTLLLSKILIFLGFIFITFYLILLNINISIAQASLLISCMSFISGLVMYKMLYFGIKKAKVSRKGIVLEKHNGENIYINFNDLYEIYQQNMENRFSDIVFVFKDGSRYLSGMLDYPIKEHILDSWDIYIKRDEE